MTAVLRLIMGVQIQTMTRLARGALAMLTALLSNPHGSMLVICVVVFFFLGSFTGDLSQVLFC